ncbi:hypothetical protein EVAR_43706_1 [Eumeta japonica]|uniref:Uncharacterized protein n=1 Tax=Eumeta variegata TaxID=151549 RepID=A0A4C1X0N3_EUMVA|nr:hypothetical protein EVAR_43706_1 [Eumeta japonica]
MCIKCESPGAAPARPPAVSRRRVSDNTFALYHGRLSSEESRARVTPATGLRPPEIARRLKKKNTTFSDRRSDKEARIRSVSNRSGRVPRSYLNVAALEAPVQRDSAARRDRAGQMIWCGTLESACARHVVREDEQPRPTEEVAVGAGER